MKGAVDLKALSFLETSFVRVIRHCLEWLPFDFRREFHADLEQTALDEIAESKSHRSVAVLTRTAWRSAVSVITTAVHEHWLVLLADVRSAIARARATPLPTAAIVLTFTIAFSINTVVLSAVDRLFWNPLPAADIERLAFIHETSAGLQRMSVAYPNYLDWRERVRGMDAWSAYRMVPMTMNVGPAADRVSVAQADPMLLSILGLQPLTGRSLIPEDEALSSFPTLLITDSFWRARFGRADDIVGRAVQLNGVSSTIVGVVPDVPMLLPGVQVWTPLARRASSLADRSQHLGLWVIGRLRPEWTPEMASAEFRQVAEALGREHPLTNRGNSVGVVAMRQHVTAETRAAIAVLGAAAAGVSLIAALNVSALLLARWQRRSREAALRVALGSSFGRLARQIATESLALSTISLVCGAGLGYAALVLIRWNSAEIAEIRSLDVGAWVLGASFALSIVIGLATAIWSTRFGRRLDLYGVLQDPEAGGRPTPLRLRSWLTTCQVALASCLLILAGLFAKAYLLVEPQTSIVRPEGLLAVTVQTEAGTPGRPGTVHRIDEIERELGSTPTRGNLAAIASREPHVLGRQIAVSLSGREEQEWAEVASVTPGYLRTVGLSIRSGRDFQLADDSNSRPVAIVDDVLARRLFGGTEVGPRSLRITAGIKPVELEVVGVTTHFNASAVDPQMGQLYLPLTQNPTPDLTYVFRPQSALEQARVDLRSALVKSHPGSGIGPVETATEILNRRNAPRVLAVGVLGVFAALSWVLALAGIYGVASSWVAGHSRDFALRNAVGARPRQLVWFVWRQCLRVTLAGLGAGMILASALGLLIRTIVVDVSPMDLTTFLWVGGSVVATVLAAAYFPARQACSASLMQLMRSTG